jgi:serine protease Do/serine protease DegQ
MVRSLMAQLLEHGEVKRGLLGVRMQDLTPSLADAFGISGAKGAVISEVIPGSAAEDKGMEEGDVIVSFNNTPVESGADLRNAVGLLRPGTATNLEFYRDGELHSITVKIKELNELASIDTGVIERLHGAKFRNVEPGGEVKSGVVVFEIEPQSAAASSGLEKGDIIVSINRQQISGLEDMKNVVKNSNGILLIKLLRNSRSLFLVIQ